MTKSTPKPPETDAVIAPEYLDEGWQGCDCTDCRERREGKDRTYLYTPHDVADAWSTGWRRGFEKGAAFGRRTP